MIATLNGWIGTALIGLGLVTFAIGIFFGIFAWMNDGAQAALRMVIVTTAFGGGLAAAGLLLRFAGAAHARGDPRRWWIQLFCIIGVWLALGFAAFLSSLADRLIPPR